ncbi:MAG TPA: hypothetical protein PLO98_02425, partial [Bacteroidia bacterium]|nr:hypothetical protein [Bacteroidia bacterium]
SNKNTSQEELILKQNFKSANLYELLCQTLIKPLYTFILKMITFVSHSNIKSKWQKIFFL